MHQYNIRRSGFIYIIQLYNYILRPDGDLVLYVCMCVCMCLCVDKNVTDGCDFTPTVSLDSSFSDFEAAVTMTSAGNYLCVHLTAECLLNLNPSQAATRTSLTPLPTTCVCVPGQLLPLSLVLCHRTAPSAGSCGRNKVQLYVYRHFFMEREASATLWWLKLLTEQMSWSSFVFLLLESNMLSRSWTHTDEKRMSFPKHLCGQQRHKQNKAFSAAHPHLLDDWCSSEDLHVWPEKKDGLKEVDQKFPVRA